MDVREVQEKRDELEKDVRRLLENFRSETGVTPHLEVYWHDVSTVTSRSVIFAAPEVTVKLAL